MAIQHSEELDICIDVFCANMRLFVRQLDKLANSVKSFGDTLSQEIAVISAQEIIDNSNHGS